MASYNDNTANLKKEQKLLYESDSKHIMGPDDKTLEEHIENIKKELDLHNHTSEDIITDENKKFVSQQQIDSWNLGPLYNNSNAIIQNLGGINKGDTFQNKTVSQMFDKILYPHIPHNIEASTHPISSGIFEIGQTKNITNFTIDANGGSNKITNIQIYDNDTKIIDFPNNMNTLSFNIPKSINISSDKQYTIKVTDDTGYIHSVKTGKISFVYPIYYGAIDWNTNIPNEIQIKESKKKIVPKQDNDIKFTCNNQKILFAYPSSYGDLNNIIDMNGLDITNIFHKNLVKIALNNNEIYYNTYISDNSITIYNFSIKFIF